MDKNSVNGQCAVKKYNIARSEKLGRYMIAAKDLAAGELIFREDVLTVGPATFETNIFCFSCMRPLPGYFDIKTRYACSNCKVAPLCNRACENIGRLHSTQECNLFRDNKDLYVKNIGEVTRILLHLRLWLLKDNNENDDTWQKIESMECHMEERRRLPVWQERETTIVDVFRKFGLHHTDDDSVQRLSGIIDVNTFELRAPAVPSETGGPLRGLFLQASLMAHECRATAHVSVDESFHMSVHAAKPIPARGIISFNYTSSLLGTIDRQKHLQEGKYFRCECKACEEPLEAGSYLSCLLCPHCKEDYVAMQNVKEAYEKGAKWQCQSCKKTISGCLVKTAIEIGKSLINDTDEDDFKATSDLLEKLSRTFHKNHYLMLSLKNKILVLCRKELGRINPDKKVLEKMLELCEEVVRVLEIVEPGLSRLKGIMLYEMHLPLTILANRAYAAREITAQELLSRLEMARNQLRRALSMLLLEPAMTPEGQLAKRALQEMKMLTRSVGDAEALVAAFEEGTKKQRQQQLKGGRDRNARRK